MEQSQLRSETSRLRRRMSDLIQVNPTKTSAPPPQAQPDYYSRALALYPRLEPARLARVRSDPNRVAALISRRTTLPVKSILALLGAPQEAGDGHAGKTQTGPPRGHGVSRRP